ncbi:MAG: FAD-dependent oxidoreductase [Saonia sp.]
MKIEFKKRMLTVVMVSIALGFGTGKVYGQEKRTQADVIIYGGTSAGIAAAIEVDKMGKTVLVIEPSSRIGGLSTGGLGQTDIGNKQVIGGISLEFYKNIKKYYQNPKNWKWQKPSEYKDGGQTKTEAGEQAMWTFEPSAALNVFHQMIKGTNIKLVYGQRLNRTSGVRKTDNKITSILMESGEEYLGHMFIDATYEGDLMAAAGVSFTVGRESNSQYGENLNGVQANTFSPTLLGTPSTNGANHNFVDGVDPYVIKGDKSSGVLPYIDSSGPGKEGEGDKRVQAYCFRMCLTDHPENRIPFKKPDNYNELNYELLFRNYEAGFDDVPWINSSMPNRKTDTNNKNGFSTDFVGQNYDYPTASYEEREKIVENHRNYQQGLMWTLAYHPRIPANIRKEASRWGTSKDEFEREDGWQQQLYIREARRMVGEYVMTQKNCEGINVITDAIGMAAYGMDSHNVQRYIDDNGQVKNEGNVEAKFPKPYPISYRSITPTAKECANLLVPVSLSASHIAYGSIRMEPVFMILGQSAAIAAMLAIDHNSSVQEVNYGELKKILVAKGQILE